MALVGITTFGKAAGEEFSPDTFERRVFHYYQVPLLEAQVTPVFRTDCTGTLESMLINRKYLKQVNIGNPKWDLVESGVTDGVTATGDAKILQRYLTALDTQGDVYWEDWTTEHKNQAKVLWPLVAKSSRQELYFLLPEMFRMADQDIKAKDLAKELEQYIGRECERLGQQQQELGRHRLAVKLLSITLEYEPNDVSALRSRAKSHESLGETQKAEADRKAAAASTDVGA